jgi:hypothetical protein
MSVDSYVPKFQFSRVFPGALLLLLALFAATPRAKADNWDDCNRRIERARWQLHEAIEGHGYDSRQARHWRHELLEEYERRDRLSRKSQNERWRDRDSNDRRDYGRSYSYYDNRYRQSDRDDYGRYYHRDRDDDYY